MKGMTHKERLAVREAQAAQAKQAQLDKHKAAIAMARRDRQAQLNASQSTAQLIFGFLQSEPTPRDAAATLAAVHAALIWTQEQENEDRARKMAQEMVDGIILLWKANRDAQVN